MTTQDLGSPRVTLDIVTRDIPSLLAKANVVHNAMTAASATFTAPVPTMPVLLSLIQATDAAQQAALTRARGLASARNVQARGLASALHTERAYVQSLVDATPDQALRIAELAGMSIAAPRVIQKPVLALALGEQPGTMTARANATLLRQGLSRGARVTFNWRYSADGGKTFVAAPSTPLAKASFTGLTSLVAYGVQVCITSAAGTTAWSQMVTILVH
jgi:hypothetical protein